MSSLPDDLGAAPKTAEELQNYLASLIAGVSDPNTAYGPNKDSYGKCVEAMARAAWAAHEYTASQLGVTGFQHEMASMYALRLIRRIDGPWMIVTLRDLLYPQYDKIADVQKFIDDPDVRAWLRDEAAKRLAEHEAHGIGSVHVVEHWKMLAAWQPEAANDDT